MAPSINREVATFVPKNIAAAAGGLLLGKAIGVTAGALSTNVTTGESGIGKLVGEGFPTKLNAAGEQQPFTPISGRWLSPSVNSGVRLSPVAQISAGFGQGYSNATTGVMMPDPLTNLQAWAQVAGNVIGSLIP
jgi:hypothetical protein